MENIFIPESILLREYVQYFWILRGDGGGEPTLLPPEPCFDCILSFGSHTSAVRPGLGLETIQGSFLGAIRTGPLSVAPGGAVDYLAIRFYPHGLFPFFGMSCRALDGGMVELGKLNTPLHVFAEPHEYVYMDDAARVRLVEMALLSILEKGVEETPGVFRHALNLMQRSSGQLSVEAVADYTGSSSRQLHRFFDRYAGVSPKMFCRIVRFSGMMRLLEDPRMAGDLAGLAYDCGYADQAHMIHECRSLSGLSPGRLRELLRV